MYKLALVARTFNYLAQKYLYRKLRFTFALYWDVRNKLLLQNLYQDPTKSSSVREIYINWAPGVIPRQEKGDGSKLMDQLIMLIPRFIRLRQLM